MSKRQRYQQHKRRRYSTAPASLVPPVNSPSDYLFPPFKPEEGEERLIFKDARPRDGVLVIPDGLRKHIQNSNVLKKVLAVEHGIPYPLKPTLRRELYKALKDIIDQGDSIPSEDLDEAVRLMELTYPEQNGPWGGQPRVTSKGKERAASTIDMSGEKSETEAPIEWLISQSDGDEDAPGHAKTPPAITQWKETSMKPEIQRLSAFQEALSEASAKGHASPRQSRRSRPPRHRPSLPAKLAVSDHDLGSVRSRKPIAVKDASWHRPSKSRDIPANFGNTKTGVITLKCGDNAKHIRRKPPASQADRSSKPGQKLPNLQNRRDEKSMPSGGSPLDLQHPRKGTTPYKQLPEIPKDYNGGGSNRKSVLLPRSGDSSDRRVVPKSKSGTFSAVGPLPRGVVPKYKSNPSLNVTSKASSSQNSGLTRKQIPAPIRVEPQRPTQIDLHAAVPTAFSIRTGGPTIAIQAQGRASIVVYDGEEGMTPVSEAALSSASSTHRYSFLDKPPPDFIPGSKRTEKRAKRSMPPRLVTPKKGSPPSRPTTPTPPGTPIRRASPRPPSPGPPPTSPLPPIPKERPDPSLLYPGLFRDGTRRRPRPNSTVEVRSPSRPQDCLVMLSEGPRSRPLSTPSAAAVAPHTAPSRLPSLVRQLQEMIDNPNPPTPRLSRPPSPILNSSFSNLPHRYPRQEGSEPSTPDYEYFRWKMDQDMQRRGEGRRYEWVPGPPGPPRPPVTRTYHPRRNEQGEPVVRPPKYVIRREVPREWVYAQASVDSATGRGGPIEYLVGTDSPGGVVDSEATEVGSSDRRKKQEQSGSSSATKRSFKHRILGLLKK